LGAQLVDLLLHGAHLIFELLDILCVIRKDNSWRGANGGPSPHRSQGWLAQLKLKHCIHSRSFTIVGFNRRVVTVL
jgi:hypothetical protein